MDDDIAWSFQIHCSHLFTTLIFFVYIVPSLLPLSFSSFHHHPLIHIKTIITLSSILAMNDGQRHADLSRGSARDAPPAKLPIEGVDPPPSPGEWYHWIKAWISRGQFGEVQNDPLMNMPPQRDIYMWADTDVEHFLRALDTTRRVKAAMAYMVGDVVPHGCACCRLKQGPPGPFAQCVVLQGDPDGQCANCNWGHRRCVFCMFLTYYSDVDYGQLTLDYLLDPPPPTDPEVPIATSSIMSSSVAATTSSYGNPLARTTHSSQLPPSVSHGQAPLAATNGIGMNLPQPIEPQITMGPATPMFRQPVVYPSVDRRFDPAFAFTTGGSGFDNATDFSQESGQLEYGAPAEDTRVEVANSEVDVQRAQTAQTLERLVDEAGALAENSYNSMRNLAPRIAYLIEKREALKREVAILEEEFIGSMLQWKASVITWDMSVRSGKP